MLTNLQELKNFLGITSPDDDNLLYNYLITAQKQAENYCNTLFDGATYTEIYDGDGTHLLAVKVVPIKEVVALYDDVDRQFNEDTLIDSDCYAVDYESGIIALDGLVFTKGVQNVKVIYKAGYGEDYINTPEDLKLAILYLASAIYLTGKAGVNVFENQEMTFRPEYLRKRAFEILDNYRRLSI